MSFESRLRLSLPKPVSFRFLSKGYSLNHFSKDALAGLTVAMVALPLAMAFGIASGVTPEKGLITAIVAGFVISALGGSRFQVGGPTGAFVVIIYATIAKHGLEGLALATLMAGIFLVIFGLTGLGALIRFIPYPVTTGFTAGIGILIFTQQVQEFLGLPPGSSGPDFVSKWSAYLAQAGQTNFAALGVGAITLAVLLLVRREMRRVPAPMVAVALISVALLLLGLNVETIGTRFGGIPSALPLPENLLGIFNVDFALVSRVLPDALAIALLAGMESLLSAVVADGMTGDRHDANTELAAQGMANMASALFGGIPATGAIARTATNIRSGAYSPVSGLMHALFLVVFVLVMAPLASYIPLAGLAAVLMVVAWDMSDVNKLKRMFHAPAEDVAVMLLTLALTVFVDLTVALLVGVVLASLLFMRRMSELTDLRLGAMEPDPGGPSTDSLVLPQGVVVYEIEGPFFFGCAERLMRVITAIGPAPRCVILRMRRVPAMDASGINTLEALHDRLSAFGSCLVLSGVRDNVRQKLERMGTLEIIGRRNVTGHIHQAVSRATEAVSENKRGESAGAELTNPC